MDSRIKAVMFDEGSHTYTYNGRTLHGITGTIGKLMGKSFPDTDVVKVATLYGSDVHKDVENYFNNNNHWFNSTRLSTMASQWVIDELRAFCIRLDGDANHIECEVMVSDFEGTASKVDIVVRTKQGKAYLFDIKTTSHFDRPYCSWQLSIYKKLFAQCYDEEPQAMFVLATKSRRMFRILPQDDSKIEKVLEINKRELTN